LLADVALLSLFSSVRLFFPPNFWMTKIKPHENCEISSDGGHVPGLHKIVVMSFPGKEQSTLSSAFVKTKKRKLKNNTSQEVTFRQSHLANLLLIVQNIRLTI